MDMNNQDNNNEQLIRSLQNQITDLKKLATSLTEAANLSKNKESSWVYAMEGNRDGVWDWNAVTNEVFFSKRWKEMLGFHEDEISNHLSEWDKRIHPDDKDEVYADLKAHLDGERPYYENEHRLQQKDGSYIWILDRGKIMSWTAESEPLRVVGTHTDVTLRKQTELENLRLLGELREALGKVNLLKGLLPICSYCKKIRDDKGYWNSVESYIMKHSGVDFTHSMCPECEKKFYAELALLEGPHT